MDYYNTSQFLTAILGAFLGAFILVLTVSLLLSVLSIIGHWKVFSKAGQPGWGAIVPFFGSYLLHKISWGNGWFFLVPLVLTFLGGLFVDSFFGTLFAIISIAFICLTRYKTAKAFGKDAGFTVGLVLLNWLFTLILGCSNAKYCGVPRDGFSYEELCEKIRGRKDNTHFDN